MRTVVCFLIAFFGFEVGRKVLQLEHRKRSWWGPYLPYFARLGGCYAFCLGFKIGKFTSSSMRELRMSNLFTLCGVVLPSDAVCVMILIRSYSILPSPLPAIHLLTLLLVGFQGGFVPFCWCDLRAQIWHCLILGNIFRYAQP